MDSPLSVTDEPMVIRAVVEPETPVRRVAASGSLPTRNRAPSPVRDKASDSNAAAPVAVRDEPSVTVRVPFEANTTSEAERSSPALSSVRLSVRISRDVPPSLSWRRMPPMRRLSTPHEVRVEVRSATPTPDAPAPLVRRMPAKLLISTVAPSPGD
jgi:hypothetical protein